MIIDIHYHYFPADTPDQEIQQIAEGMARFATLYRVPTPHDQVVSGFPSLIKDPDGEKLLRRMQRQGIDLTVLVMTDLPRFSDEDALSRNKGCADFARKHQKHLMAFAGIDLGRKNAPYMLRKCVEDFGMKGLKLHPDLGYFWLNSETAYETFKIAEKLSIPILTHCKPSPAPYKSKYAHPLVLDDITADFVRLNVIAAHSGGNWWHDWAAIAEMRPNLFGDLAEGQCLATTRYDRFCRQLREMLDLVGPRILLGTDGPCFETIVPTEKWVASIKDLTTKAPSGIKFSHEEVEGILGGTARKLLGL